MVSEYPRDTAGQIISSYIGILTYEAAMISLALGGGLGATLRGQSSSKTARRAITAPTRRATRAIRRTISRL